MGNDKHKPGCAVNHPKSGKPWFMSCTCGIGSPPVCPHDGNALRPSCVYVPCLHYHPGKTNCGLIKPTPPHKARAKDGMPFDYCPACEQQLDTGWECISGCGRDWQAYARSQLKSAPPAPTADAVREARERCHTVYVNPHIGSPYLLVAPQDWSIILAALDKAQEEVERLTQDAWRKRHYEKSLNDQCGVLHERVREECAKNDALRAENTRLVEERDNADRASCDLLRRAERAEEQNAVQAEEIARLTKALERLAQPMDCGCNPCRGQCTSKESLELELEGLRDFAQAALKPSTKTCEPKGGIWTK